MISRIVKVSPVAVPEGSESRRGDIRAKELQDPTYSDKYDDVTVFYDTVASSRDLLLMGPPLVDFEEFVLNGEFTLGGQPMESVSSKRLERSQLTRVSFSREIHAGDEVEFRMQGNSTPFKITPSNDNDLFAGKRVLMTVQKDEELVWIADWVTYYARVHDCDAVLIYDNGSTKYEAHAILDVLSAVPGIETIVVVDWPFKYGPQGSPWVGKNVPWDSDFCQIGAFQDARYRFLQECSGVINADVDELVVPLGGYSVTLFEELERTSSGVVGYSGRWIENAPLGLQDSELPRHWNFFQVMGLGKQCNPKWIARPSAWAADAHPTPHYIRNVTYNPSPHFFVAHFRGLSSGWKNLDRLKTFDGDAPLRPDVSLSRALEKAFPDHVSSDTVLEELGCDTKNADMLHFQNWLSDRIAASADRELKWVRKWVWRDSVLVYEIESPLGRIAFDVHFTSDSCHLAVSVRDSSRKDELVAVVKALQVDNPTLAPKANGVWVLEIKVGPSGWDSLGDQIISVIRSCVGRILDATRPSESLASILADSGRVHRMVRNPLANLRGSDHFGEAAKRIRSHAGARKLLYVPNNGNWGDGLIHKGILQFFEHFGLDYIQADRSEVRAWKQQLERTGARLNDVVLVSGGGGSWRNDRSGNRKFVHDVSSLFERLVVLPHTYETGAEIDSQCEALFFARDSSLSLESMPEAFLCHDMALFLQLPSIADLPSKGGTGFFMRNDPEKNGRASAVAESFDLSKLGNHLSNITPFFQILAPYSHIVTDRMHVGIAGAMLGKKVDLFPGNYSKANAVYKMSLENQFPEVTMRSW